MDNFRIYSYNEILELNNKSKKLVDVLPEVVILKYFGKSLIEYYGDINKILPQGETTSDI
jgi:hypothetical protein